MAPASSSREHTTSPRAAEVQPLHPEGLAAGVIGIAGALLIISTIVILLRIWVRAWLLREGKAWGWDDTLATLSFVSP